MREIERDREKRMLMRAQWKERDTACLPSQWRVIYVLYASIFFSDEHYCNFACSRSEKSVVKWLHLWEELIEENYTRVPVTRHSSRHLSVAHLYYLSGAAIGQLSCSNGFLSDSLARAANSLHNFGLFLLHSVHSTRLSGCINRRVSAIGNLPLLFLGLEFRCAFLAGRIMRVNRDKRDFGSGPAKPKDFGQLSQLALAIVLCLCRAHSQDQDQEWARTGTRTRCEIWAQMKRLPHQLSRTHPGRPAPPSAHPSAAAGR